MFLYQPESYVALFIKKPEVISCRAQTLDSPFCQWDWKKFQRKAKFASYVAEVRLKVDKKMVIYVGVLFDKTARYKSKLFWCSAYFILMSSNLLMLCRGPVRGGKIVCLSSVYHFDFFVVLSCTVSVGGFWSWGILFLAISCWNNPLFWIYLNIVCAIVCSMCLWHSSRGLSVFVVSSQGVTLFILTLF